MIKIFSLCVMACLSFGLFSCQNDDNLPPDPNLKNVMTKSVENDESYYVNKMAEHLNKAIQDPAVLEVLKEEAKKQMDGDYDVLLAQAFANGSTLSGNSVLSAVATKVSVSRSSAMDEFMALVEGFKKEAPLLNVYLPDDQDFGAANDFLTVILEPSFNDREDHVVKAFNRRGDLIEISADEEPELPYMVVGINERITLEPQTVLTRSSEPAIFSNEYHSYYLPDCFNQVKKDSFIPQTRASYRNDRQNSDVISRAKFKSSAAIKNVEKWVRGAPEVHLTVVYADKSILDVLTGPLLHNLQYNLGDNGWYRGKRRKKRPCDNYGNWYITNWKNVQKSYMKYHFHEMDNHFKVTVAGWEIQFSGGNLIGDCKVNYGDALGTTYHMSNMFEIDVK